MGLYNLVAHTSFSVIISKQCGHASNESLRVARRSTAPSSKGHDHTNYNFIIHMHMNHKISLKKL